MRVTLNDPALIPDLLAFLGRMGYAGEPVERATIEIAFPPDRPADAAALEVELYLATWRALHPDAVLRLG